MGEQTRLRVLGFEKQETVRQAHDRGDCTRRQAVRRCLPQGASFLGL